LLKQGEKGLKFLNHDWTFRSEPPAAV
jgi:hypothetical protein